MQKLTKESGLDGVVCSTLEVPKLREVCGNEFVTVTPGIRLASDDVNDQVRVATPKRARELGSSYIVVGRSITKAENPLEAYKNSKTTVGRCNSMKKRNRIAFIRNWSSIFTTE